MSTEIAEVSNVIVADEPPELQLIAHSREQMAAAQTKLISWAQKKSDEYKAEAADASNAAVIALAAGFATAPFHRTHRKAMRLGQYYDKIKAALEAGYVLIPEFPVDVFAVRTKKKLPEPMTSRYRNDTRPQSSEGPPIGDGRYVDSDPVIGHAFNERITDEKTKAVSTISYWRADEFKDVIDFPMSVAKAEIMDDVACAMQHKIFDEIGVLPNRRIVKKDPIVVGIIRDPRSATYSKKRLMFLIAWYLDTRTI